VVLGFSALLSGTSSAQTQTASLDTCTATGSGTAYTLNISIPSGAPQQYGFAFGGPGANVTNIDIAGTEGTLSNQSLPANTTSSWMTPSPLMPGSSVASVATSAPVTGSFRVVPVSASQPTATYLDPINCAIVHGTPLPSNAFTIIRPVTYSSAGHVWRMGVHIPGAGIVSAKQLLPTIGTGSSKSATAKSPVQVRSLGLKSAGKVMLTLKPTAAGLAALNKTGSIKLKLDVVYAPTGGKSGSKILALTLKR
jgi:hypothetical protein